MNKILIAIQIILIVFLAGCGNKSEDVGDLKNELPDGKGIMIYEDGSKYDGEWKEGQKDGKGTFTASDGMKYVGEFKHGKNHGHGSLIFPDGEMWDGEFREDKPWNTTHHDKNVNIFGKYVDGKWRSAESN